MDNSFTEDNGATFLDPDFISLTARYRLILERRLKHFPSDEAAALQSLIAPVVEKILTLCPQSMVPSPAC